MKNTRKLRRAREKQKESESELIESKDQNNQPDECYKHQSVHIKIWFFYDLVMLMISLCPI